MSRDTKPNSDEKHSTDLTALWAQLRFFAPKDNLIHRHKPNPTMLLGALVHKKCQLTLIAALPHFLKKKEVYTHSIFINVLNTLFQIIFEEQTPTKNIPFPLTKQDYRKRTFFTEDRILQSNNQQEDLPDYTPAENNLYLAFQEIMASQGDETAKDRYRQQRDFLKIISGDTPINPEKLYLIRTSTLLRDAIKEESVKPGATLYMLEFLMRTHNRILWKTPNLLHHAIQHLPFESFQSLHDKIGDAKPTPKNISTLLTAEENPLESLLLHPEPETALEKFHLIKDWINNPKLPDETLRKLFTPTLSKSIAYFDTHPELRSGIIELIFERGLPAYPTAEEKAALLAPLYPDAPPAISFKTKLSKKAPLAPIEYAGDNKEETFSLMPSQTSPLCFFKSDLAKTLIFANIAGQVDIEKNIATVIQTVFCCFSALEIEQKKRVIQNLLPYLAQENLIIHELLSFKLRENGVSFINAILDLGDTGLQLKCIEQALGQTLLHHILFPNELAETNEETYRTLLSTQHKILLNNRQENAADADNTTGPCFSRALVGGCAVFATVVLAFISTTPNNGNAPAP